MSVFAQRRRALLRAARKEHRLDTVFITNQSDIFYLSGCHEGASALLFDARDAILFSGEMFANVISKEAPDCELRILRKSVYAEAAAIINRKHRRALGFQGGVIPHARYNLLAEAMGRRKLVDIGGLVTVCRGVKDEKEIKLITKCVRIAEKAFSDITSRGSGYFMGKSEKQLAAELEFRMRTLGADRQAFLLNGIIVASGPNSAVCHHVPTNRRIRANEPLLFDWGAELDNYRSDITRTLFIRKAPPLLAEIYETVREANDAGIKAIRAGVNTRTVASKAWGVVREAGYGDIIRHGLGHGVGIDVHEYPGLGNGDPKTRTGTRLRRNQVVTVEPGIYIDGKGGVRIEDDILVTDRGRRCLTRLPKDMNSAIIL